MALAALWPAYSSQYGSPVDLSVHSTHQHWRVARVHRTVECACRVSGVKYRLRSLLRQRVWHGRRRLAVRAAQAEAKEQRNACAAPHRQKRERRVPADGSMVDVPPANGSNR